MKSFTKFSLIATLAASAVVFSGAFSGSLMAQATAPAAGTAKAAKAAMPSDSDIADAKTKGQVWVNLNTKAYHASTDPLYGKTKHGQFMAMADADKAGYHMAGNKKKKAADPASK
jgi:hypothetical protein